MKPWTFFILVLLGLALALNFCMGQDVPPAPPLTGLIIGTDGKTNVVVFNESVKSITWETNGPPAPPNTTNYNATNWPSLDNRVWLTNGPGGWGIANPRTNSFLSHPERKRKVIAYRKECPECGVTLTSTNITSWTVSDETNSFRMVTVGFECRGCDETYSETFRKPIRKTKVEEVTTEVVK